MSGVSFQGLRRYEGESVIRTQEVLYMYPGVTMQWTVTSQEDCRSVISQGGTGEPSLAVLTLLGLSAFWWTASYMHTLRRAVQGHQAKGLDFSFFFFDLSLIVIWRVWAL